MFMERIVQDLLEAQGNERRSPRWPTSWHDGWPRRPYREPDLDALPGDLISLNRFSQDHASTSGGYGTVTDVSFSKRRTRGRRRRAGVEEGTG